MSDSLPDLGTYIDQAIDAGVIDVAEVAVKVKNSAPGEVIEAHLLYFLRLAVRDRMAKRRSTNAIVRGATAHTRMVAGRPAVTSAPAVNKRARQRNQFASDRARWLADTVWTGTNRVTLGEATVADLMAAAQALREQASRSVASATRFEQIAHVLLEARVPNVAALPDAELRALMDRP